MIDCNRLEYLFQDTKYDFSDQTIPRDFSRIVDLTPFEKLLKDKNKNNKPSTKFRSNSTVLFTHPPRLKKSYHYTNLDTLANTFLSGTGTAVRTDSSSSNSKKLARGRKIRKRSKRQKLSQVSNDCDSILQNNSSVESAIRVQQIDTSNLKKRRRKTFRT